MKKSSDDLFQLIKSLEKNEKRYFRIFSTFHGGNKNYMLVFDTIEKQKSYNEEAIIELFRKKKIASRFPLVKQYLYNLILSSLEAYHTNIEYFLAGHIHRIAILCEKGLYVQCEKILTKAKQLAIKHDLHMPLLELMKWEVKLMSKQSFAKTNETGLRQMFNTISNTIDQYKSISESSLYNSLLFLYDVKKGNARSQSDIKKLHKTMEEADFRSTKDNTSYQIQFVHYQTYGVYYYLLNDYEKSYPYWNKLIQLMEEHPHQITENLKSYIGTMQNLYATTMYMRKYNECVSIIEKLKKLKIKSLNINKHLYILTNELEVWLSIETGAFNKGLQLSNSIEKDKTTFKMISKGALLLFHYNTAYLHFATGNYTKANEYLNKVLNEEIGSRNDIQYFARILSLVVYFEMGNLELLEYRIKSVYRFLYKWEQLYTVETIILDFIQKEFPKINSNQKLIKSFGVLLERMKSINRTPFEQRAFHFFDFISWLESKVENKSFAEIVRKKSLISRPSKSQI